jgi:hypothetical protein
MKIAALILGIIGGIAGLIGSIFAMGIGAVGGGTTGNGIAALVFSLLGIVAGSLVLAKPKPAGILLIIASVGGLIAVFVAYIIAFPLLLTSGIMGLVGAKKK